MLRYSPPNLNVCAAARHRHRVAERNRARVVGLAVGRRVAGGADQQAAARDAGGAARVDGLRGDRARERHLRRVVAGRSERERVVAAAG